MKKIYSLIVCMFMCTLSVSADGWKVNDNVKVRPSAQMPLNKMRNSMKQWKGTQKITTRAVDETSFVGLKATDAQTWYYADLAGNGTSCFYVILSTTGIADGGIPDSPGQLLYAAIFTEPVEDSENLSLPTGTYSIVEDPTYSAGEVFDSYAGFWDCFYNPDDATDTLLYANMYDANDRGVLTISKDANGTYTINADFDMVLLDENYDPVDTVKVTMDYTGDMEFVDMDPSKYTPIEGDYQMNIPNASGRYTSSSEYGYGNFTIAFYGDDMLDDKGYIVGDGDLFNLELLVPEAVPADYTKLAGTYEYQSMMGGVYTPGHFIGGYWYESYGYYYAIGTSLSTYLSGYVDMVGLAESGTVVVTDKGNGVFKFDFDLYTPESAHMTGSWEGNLATYITDYTGIKGVSINNAAKTVDVYTLDGVRVRSGVDASTATEGLQRGVYIVGGKKVMK